MLPLKNEEIEQFAVEVRAAKVGGDRHALDTFINSSRFSTLTPTDRLKLHTELYHRIQTLDVVERFQKRAQRVSFTEADIVAYAEEIRNEVSVAPRQLIERALDTLVAGERFSALTLGERQQLRDAIREQLKPDIERERTEHLALMRKNAVAVGRRVRRPNQRERRPAKGRKKKGSEIVLDRHERQLPRGDRPQN